MTIQHLKVMPIVEGHGEVPAVPILLRRICTELLTDVVPYILPPIRQPRDRLLANKDGCLDKAVNLAFNKLRQFQVPGANDLMLVLVDADDLCAAEAGPATLSIAQSARSDADIAVVIAVMEYETWFVAAASSLEDHLRVDDLESLPDSPETQRCGKGWIKKRFKGPKYSETVDQPKLTAKMDLTLCRKHSPSFDKLCRVIEARVSLGVDIG